MARIPIIIAGSRSTTPSHIIDVYCVDIVVSWPNSRPCGGFAESAVEPGVADFLAFARSGGGKALSFLQIFPDDKRFGLKYSIRYCGCGGKGTDEGDHDKEVGTHVDWSREW
jgi:hypothetical protein